MWANFWSVFRGQVVSAVLITVLACPHEPSGRYWPLLPDGALDLKAGRLWL